MVLILLYLLFPTSELRVMIGSQKRKHFNLHGHAKEEDLVDSLRKFALQNLIEEDQYYTEKK